VIAAVGARVVSRCHLRLRGLSRHSLNYIDLSVSAFRLLAAIGSGWCSEILSEASGLT
jgi:hypothetical protein